jgi:hypothetical protein
VLGVKPNEGQKMSIQNPANAEQKEVVIFFENGHGVWTIGYRDCLIADALCKFRQVHPYLKITAMLPEQTADGAQQIILVTEYGESYRHYQGPG